MIFFTNTWDYFSRQFAICSNVLKLLSKTIILDLGCFLLIVFELINAAIKLFKYFILKELKLFY